MGFISFPFLIFFFILFIVYWFTNKYSYKQQNVILLIANYIFYLYLDSFFLLILILISITSFYISKHIEETEKLDSKLKIAVVGTIFILLFLIYFKYLNPLFNSLLINKKFSEIFSLKSIILPLGISYYTFKSISYIIDVKDEKISSEKYLINYLCYVSYFPSIVAGPIDRASDILPQLSKKRYFNYELTINGFRQILWGLFKKLVIADNCSAITHDIFQNPQVYPSSSLIIGMFLFSIEVYADFSGYSDIAIGISKTLGINLMPNFQYPYFSKSIPEFWRRWHISLTSWLTDYVFTPLSIYFREYGKNGLFLSILINFFLVGLWHGSKINYILYGIIHGLYFIPIIYKKKKKKKNINVVNNKFLKNTIYPIAKMISIYLIVVVTFMIFKLDTINDVIYFYSKILSKSIIERPKSGNLSTVLTIILLTFIMFWTEWKSMIRNEEFGISNIQKYHKKSIRWAIYCSLLFLIGMYMNTSNSTFLYFKF